MRAYFQYARAWFANWWCLKKHNGAVEDGAWRCKDCWRAYTVGDDLRESQMFDQRDTWHPDGRKKGRASKRREFRETFKNARRRRG